MGIMKTIVCLAACVAVSAAFLPAPPPPPHYRPHGYPRPSPLGGAMDPTTLLLLNKNGGLGVTAFFPFSFSAEAADWEALMGRVLTRSYFLCLEYARRSIRPVPRLLMLTPTQPKNAVLILALVVMGISVICAVHVTDLSHHLRKQDVKE